MHIRLGNSNTDKELVSIDVEYTVTCSSVESRVLTNYFPTWCSDKSPFLPVPRFHHFRGIFFHGTTTHPHKTQTYTHHFPYDCPLPHKAAIVNTLLLPPFLWYCTKPSLLSQISVSSCLLPTVEFWRQTCSQWIILQLDMFYSCYKRV